MFTTTSPTSSSGAFRVGYLRLRGLVHELAKFGVVGLVSLVVDVGLFNLLRYAGGEGPFYDKPLTAKFISVLVATTVIEVGVDVPNATVMVVLDADRFGIAQLHQLRGRVGRGSIASTCWLQTKDADEHSPRVDALVGTTDGFELAEIDLELRGEGTLMNTAQKGRSDLKLASLRRDRDLIDMAREAAFAIIDEDPTLKKHKVLRDEIELLLTPEEEEFLFKS